MNNPTVSLEVLAAYRRAITDANNTKWLSAQRAGSVLRLNGMLREVNRILRNLAPDFPLIKATTLTEHRSALAIVMKAEQSILIPSTVLEQIKLSDIPVTPPASAQLVENPMLVESPVLPLTMLDRVIADAALPLWEVGKYRQAVNDAATSLNQFAQAQLGRRDISDRKLMAEAFSDTPPKPGEPRLRCYHLGRAMESVHSQQEGAKFFAMGTFAAIRNPAHHETGDWNPLTAFHHLVALSQVAHYFRDWKVIKYISPPPDLSKLSVSSTKT